MKNGKTHPVEHERACARVAAHFRELWLRLYVGRKLRSDPAYPAAWALLGGSGETLIDVGCGVGLLGFYLRERNFQAPIVGLDRDRRKISRAQAVVRRSGYRELDFREEDVSAATPPTGNVVLFDVLHYLAPNEQARLLQRLIPCVAPGGLLVIRDCPRDGNARFWVTYLAERFAQATTWNIRTPLHFPTREKISAFFSPNDFSSRIEPLWGGTPFNNHLFIFRRRAPGAVPAAAGRSDNSLSLGQAG
jgi:2-polyprenyl-3-methyl-5-hydroxy-6-metoxy-1,4-benzoquinol methylase